MRTSGRGSEVTEEVIEAVAYFQVVVSPNVFSHQEAQLQVDGFGRRASGTQPEAFCHHIAQIEIDIDRRAFCILDPHRRFEKTTIVKIFHQSCHCIIVANPFCTEFSIFIFKLQIEAKDLWNGQATVDVRIVQKAARDQVVIVNAQSNIGKELGVIAARQDVVELTQANVRSLDAVLHHAEGECSRKTTVVRIVGKHPTNATVDSGKTSRASLVVDQVPASNQTEGIAIGKNVIAVERLRLGTVFKIRPLDPVRSTKRQWVFVQQIVSRQCSWIEDTDVFSVLCEEWQLLSR